MLKFSVFHRLLASVFAGAFFFALYLYQQKQTITQNSKLCQ